MTRRRVANDEHTSRSKGLMKVTNFPATDQEKGVITMRNLTMLFILFAVTTAAFSQETPKTITPRSDAKIAFEKLKSLSGSWQGSIMGIPINFTIRPASSGTAILHEGNTEKGPPDHEITMFYVEDDRLIATHYCDGGNRARLVGKMSPDGKSIEFSFLDVAGNAKGGLVKRMLFTVIDANKHMAEFTFIMPNGKSIELRGEFQRTK